jgi:hypothetical protein
MLRSACPTPAALHPHLLFVEPKAPEVPALVQAVANLGRPTHTADAAEAIVEHLPGGSKPNAVYAEKIQTQRAARSLSCFVMSDHISDKCCYSS